MTNERCQVALIHYPHVPLCDSRHEQVLMSGNLPPACRTFARARPTTRIRVTGRANYVPTRGQGNNFSIFTANWTCCLQTRLHICCPDIREREFLGHDYLSDCRFQPHCNVVAKLLFSHLHRAAPVPIRDSSDL